MSHKITIQTKITNRTVAEAALKANNWDFGYNSKDNGISIQSGPMKGAYISLGNGNVTGDTDWHRKGDLAGLNQSYAEHLIRQDQMSAGGYVESREVLADGRVRLVMAGMSAGF